MPQSVELYVVVSEKVSAAYDGGSVAALVEALEDELRQRGYRVRLTAARPEEKPPLPRIELQVLEADWGNREMRGAGSGVGLVSAAMPLAAVAGAALEVAGTGAMLVDCYVVQRDGRVTFAGRIRAGTFGSDYDGYDTVGAERAGRSIAKAIAD